MQDGDSTAERVSLVSLAPVAAPAPSLWERLTAAPRHVVDVSERQRTELLSGLLVVLVPLCFVSACLQLTLSQAGPRIFATLLAGGAFLSAVYALSRSRFHRLAASVVSIGPIAVACALGLEHPLDPVWFVFANVGVILASVLLGAKGAGWVGLLSMLCVTLTAYANLGVLTPARFVPIVMVDLVLATLIVLAARHRDRVEAERERLLRAREAQLSESRRMESIGRLAGGIAHDFNNLLTVVLANAELMGRGRAAGVAAREIETAGTRAAELTRQLLAYARQQVTSPTSVSVMQVMRAVEPILRRLLREDIRLHIEGDDLLFRVKIDPVQLEQVVLNLTVNARDAIDGAGSIYVRARNVSRVVAGVERELLCLAVRDTGHGMSAHTIAHVFEPFFTTKGPGIGTGLGLATVHTIVQDAAGFIEVESQVGEGSEFRVYLPRTTEEAAKTPASVRPGAVLASPRRTAILLVEDDALVRRSVARMLEDAELDVIEAASAMEARVTFLKNRQRIEVLLTDVVLTDASGIELAQVLRERAPQLAVLLMTGYADELARNAADIQSDWVLLNKPFSSRELRSALESVLLPSGPKRAVGG